MSDEEKTQESKVKEVPEPQAKEEVKTKTERPDLMKMIKGSGTKDYIENISFIIIVASGMMVSAGILLGSFIQGTILIASFGSLFVMIGIVTYIASQFIGVNNG